MVIEIKLLERNDLKGWLKRVKISTVLVQGVKFLTCLPRIEPFCWVSFHSTQPTPMNPKFEARNPKQARRSKIQMIKTRTF